MKTIVTETLLKTYILFLLQLLMMFCSNILLGTYRLKEMWGHIGFLAIFYK